MAIHFQLKHNAGRSDRVSGTAAAISAKAADALERAKLRRIIDDLEDEIALQMCTIGELVYATHRGNPSDSEEMQKILEYVDDLEDEIDLQLCDIGRLVYATHIGNPSDSDEIQQILTYVDGLYEEIAAHEEELERLQGSRICGVCGAANAPENVYCQDCGSPFPADGANNA